MNRATVLGGASAIVLLSAISYGIVRAGWLSSAPVAAPEATKRGANSRVSPLPPSSFDAATLSAPMTVGSIPARAGGSAPNTALPLAAAAANPSGLEPRVSAPKPIACTHPGAMGVSRVVEIDTSGGPGFGFQHFKSYDFLKDHEVVLTFDDGPWLGHTPAVLKALADQCLRATFFIIGKHSTFYPEILKQVVAAGHTVGTHTWSHADLLSVVKKGGPDAAKDEIEKGFSAVHMMAGGQIAPFFRFPDLRHPPEMVTYLGERNVGIFSTDIDSWDYKIKKPEELIKSLTAKVQKAGKGIILMHDFQKVTSIALPQILAELQKSGFKVVHMVPKEMISTLPQYDEAVLKENKLQTVTSKPAESVVRTVAD